MAGPISAVLTTTSSLICGHDGRVTLRAGHRRLVVDGRPVVRLADLPGSPISGCTNVNTNDGQVPCLAVVSVTAGVSGVLTVGGSRVLLATATGLTNGSLKGVPSTWRVSSAGQTLLESR